jgi:MoxR-like ATPase
MNQNQKKEILLKAFDEGAIILIDEINSVATMEKLLNSILDNKHPDTLQKAKNPGFRLIGTQNPAYYAGRNIDSPALASRTVLIQMPDYPSDEMIAILQAKGLSEDEAIPLVSAYEYIRKQAFKERAKHVPSFRDLIKKAEHIITAHQAKEAKFRDEEAAALILDTSDDIEIQHLKNIIIKNLEKLLNEAFNQAYILEIKIIINTLQSLTETPRLQCRLLEIFCQPKIFKLRLLDQICPKQLLPLIGLKSMFDIAKEKLHMPPWFNMLFMNHNQKLVFELIKKIKAKACEKNSPLMRKK